MTMNLSIAKAASGGYYVFLQSNEIDQGTYKTSYICLGKTDVAAKTFGNVTALPLNRA